MGVTISVNNLTLCHKGSTGVSAATVPDVCKTPSPGPVPVPYPNVARSSDLTNGTTTIQADGGSMCANYGSEFSLSTGDEAGTMGGVTSGVFKKEATWISYSFDVKLEGQGACRLSDKMFHNHQNTVNMSGLLQPPPFKPPVDPVCAKLYEVIFDLIWGQRPPGWPPQGRKGLAFRWEERATNKGGWTPEMTDAKNHLKEYEKQRENLEVKLEEWRNKKKRNCNDDDLPPGAKEYVQETLPELGPGKPTFPSPVTSQFKDYLGTLGIAVATTATAVIVLIVVSRIIRLFPPLWPLQLSPI